MLAGAEPLIANRKLATEWLTDFAAAFTINDMVDDENHLDMIFRALADPTRRAILRRLAGGEALVKDLAEPFAMSKQGVSKHLLVLEEAGLIEKQVEGRSTRVRLRPEALQHVEDWVTFYRNFWAGSLAALAEIVDREAEETLT